MPPAPLGYRWLWVICHSLTQASIRPKNARSVDTNNPLSSGNRETKKDWGRRESPVKWSGSNNFFFPLSPLPLSDASTPLFIIHLRLYHKQVLHLFLSLFFCPASERDPNRRLTPVSQSREDRQWSKDNLTTTNARSSPLAHDEVRALGSHRMGRTWIFFFPGTLPFTRFLSHLYPS